MFLLLCVPVITVHVFLLIFKKITSTICLSGLAMCGISSLYLHICTFHCHFIIIVLHNENVHSSSAHKSSLYAYPMYVKAGILVKIAA